MERSDSPVVCRDTLNKAAAHLVHVVMDRARRCVLARKLPNTLDSGFCIEALGVALEASLETHKRLSH